MRRRGYAPDTRTLPERRAAAEAHPILRDPLTTYQIVSLLAWIKSLGDNPSEAKFHAAVVKAAQQLGLLVFHTEDERGSRRGFPDLVIVGWGGIAFWELKTDTGTEMPEQTLWLFALRRIAKLTFGLVQVETYRPRDWTLDGPMVRALIKLARPPKGGSPDGRKNPGRDHAAA